MLDFGWQSTWLPFKNGLSRVWFHRNNLEMGTMSYQARAPKRRGNGAGWGRGRREQEYCFGWSLTSVQFHEGLSDLNYLAESVLPWRKGTRLLSSPNPKPVTDYRIARAVDWEKNSQNFLAKPFLAKANLLRKVADVSNSWGVGTQAVKGIPGNLGDTTSLASAMEMCQLLHQNLGPTSQGDLWGKTHSSIPPPLSYPIFIFSPAPKLSFCWNILWLSTITKTTISPLPSYSLSYCCQNMVTN